MPDFVEESILQEEALIRAYQAELSILNERSSVKAANHAIDLPTEDTDDDDDDDLLESMFPVPMGDTNVPSAMSLLASNATDINKQECLELTQSIQGFVFSSVETDTNDPNDFNGKQPSKSFMNYIFRGHFVADPSVSARIRMIVEINHPKIDSVGSKKQACPPSAFLHLHDGRYSKKQRCNSKIMSLECSLSSSSGQDVTYIETQMARKSSQRLSLPAWLQRVSAYLEFEQRQQSCIVRWNRSRDDNNDGQLKNHPYCFSLKGRGDSSSSSKRRETRSGCWIQPSGSRGKLPTFIWEWDWLHERDTLRMEVTCNNNNNNNNNNSHGTDGNSDESDDDGDEEGLTPQGLLDLVTCTRSCEKALEVILLTLS